MLDNKFEQKIPEHFLSKPAFTVDTKERSCQVEFDDTDIIVTFNKYIIKFKRVKGKLEIGSKQSFFKGDMLPDDLADDMLRAAEIAVAMYDEEIIKPARKLSYKYEKSAGSNQNNL
jgi:hypothetical protein